MSKEDARIIFNNISDLALFADVFTGRLEDALGSVLEGGHGQDRAGALFLEMVSVSLNFLKFANYPKDPNTRTVIPALYYPSPDRT